jgi:hypothetical protein
MIGDAQNPDWLATDWLLSQFGKRRKIAMERYWQFVVDGVQYRWGQVQNHESSAGNAHTTRSQKNILSTCP